MNENDAPLEAPSVEPIPQTTPGNLVGDILRASATMARERVGELGHRLVHGDIVDEAKQAVRNVPLVSAGLDWSYLRRKRAQILDALALVAVGSSLRIHSPKGERRRLDEMAANQLVLESNGALQLLEFGELHITLMRTSSFLAGTGEFDRDFFRRKGTLVDLSNAAGKIHQAAHALRLLRR